MPALRLDGNGTVVDLNLTICRKIQPAIKNIPITGIRELPIAQSAAPFVSSRIANHSGSSSGSLLALRYRTLRALITPNEDVIKMDMAEIICGAFKREFTLYQRPTLAAGPAAPVVCQKPEKAHECLDVLISKHPPDSSELATFNNDREVFS